MNAQETNVTDQHPLAMEHNAAREHEAQSRKFLPTVSFLLQQSGRTTGNKVGAPGAGSPDSSSPRLRTKPSLGDVLKTSSSTFALQFTAPAATRTQASDPQEPSSLMTILGFGSAPLTQLPPQLRLLSAIKERTHESDNHDHGEKISVSSDHEPAEDEGDMLWVEKSEVDKLRAELDHVISLHAMGEQRHHARLGQLERLTAVTITAQETEIGNLKAHISSLQGRAKRWRTGLQTILGDLESLKSCHAELNGAAVSLRKQFMEGMADLGAKQLVAVQSQVVELQHAQVCCTELRRLLDSRLFSHFESGSDSATREDLPLQHDLQSGPAASTSMLEDTASEMSLGDRKASLGYAESISEANFSPRPQHGINLEELVRLIRTEGALREDRAVLSTKVQTLESELHLARLELEARQAEVSSTRSEHDQVKNLLSTVRAADLHHFGVHVPETIPELRELFGVLLKLAESNRRILEATRSALLPAAPYLSSLERTGVSAEYLPEELVPLSAAEVAHSFVNQRTNIEKLQQDVFVAQQAHHLVTLALLEAQRTSFHQHSSDSADVDATRVYTASTLSLAESIKALGGQNSNSAALQRRSLDGISISPRGSFAEDDVSNERGILSNPWVQTTDVDSTLSHLSAQLKKLKEEADLENTAIAAANHRALAIQQSLASMKDEERHAQRSNGTLFDILISARLQKDVTPGSARTTSQEEATPDAHGALDSVRAPVVNRASSVPPKSSPKSPPTNLLLNLRKAPGPTKGSPPTSASQITSRPTLSSRSTDRPRGTSKASPPSDTTEEERARFVTILGALASVDVGEQAHPSRRKASPKDRSLSPRLGRATMSPGDFQRYLRKGNK